MPRVIEQKKEFRDNPCSAFPIQYVEGKAISNSDVGDSFQLTIFFPAMKREEIITLLCSATISIQMINETSLYISSDTMEYAILYNTLTLLQNHGLIDPEFTQTIIQNFPRLFGGTINLSRSDHRGFGFIEARIPEERPLIFSSPSQATNTPHSSSQNPQTNERQITLESLQADDIDPNDEIYECLQKLYDPVTLEAIQHPCKLQHDTTHQYFEFHTLMALERNSEGFLVHPLTKKEFQDADIQDCAEEYADLFNKVTENLRSRRENRPSP